MKMVSVIIPTYNRESTICRAIDSVLNQNYSNIEVIVIDDGSEDDTLKLLESYGEKIRILKQQHRGANVARNLGIKEANGEYIAFQDSDDEWLENKLSEQIAYMEKNDYKACYCALKVYDEDKIFYIPSDYHNRDTYEKKLECRLKKYNVIGTPSLIVAREVFNGIGFFDENIRRFQDYEFVIRTIQTYPIGYVPKPLVKVFRSKNSITVTQSADEAALTIFRKHAPFLGTIYLKNIIREKVPKRNEENANRLKNFLKLWERDVNEYPKCSQIIVETLDEEYITPVQKIQRLYYERFKKGLVSDDFVLYGAGGIGKQALEKLRLQGLEPKCFAVTKLEEASSTEIMGVPVCLIDDIDRNVPILLTASLKNQAEMLENLNILGFVKTCGYAN